MTRFLYALAMAALPLGAQPPGTETPTLVVLITVDGLPAASIEKFAPQLTGGIARLRSGGADFSNAHQDHAITETAPGHASLLSGRFPRSTGIAANSVGVSDSEAALIGTSAASGASPKRFQGTTLFDWMRARNRATRALSVSTKDRGAILPVGNAKEQVYWYPGHGAFTTSRYYAEALPAWVTAFNAKRVPQSYAGKSWTLLRPDSAYREPDSVSIEGAGNDFVFPHVLPDDPERAASLIRATPFMDEVVVAFALEGVNAMSLGKGPHPDLLAVSLSATDAVNHRLGPDSRESHDQLLRTDRLVGIFLDSLFRLRDRNRVVVVLTADHGFARVPELAAGQAPRPTRTSLDGALEKARSRMTELKIDPKAIDVDQQIVLVDHSAFGRNRARLDDVLDVFSKAALATDGVARVDRLAALYSADTLTDPIARRWTHQFGRETNVELVATATPGTLWSSVLVASHGSPYDYDSHVPLLFYGGGIAPGRHREFVRTVDIAPTLAALLGLKPSEKLDGVLLRKALK